MGFSYLQFKTVMPYFPLKVIITFLHTYKLCIRVIYSPYPDQQFRSKTLKKNFFLQFNGCKIAFHYSLCFSWLLMKLNILSYLPFVFPLLWKACLYLLPMLFFGWCLSVFIHGSSLCIKDANSISYLLLCNIAGDSGSEFLRRLQSGCWPGLQSSQSFDSDWKVHFQDHSHDCWQASVPCPVDLFIGMFTVWHLASFSEWSKREKLRMESAVFYNLISDVNTITSMYLVMQTNPGIQHKDVNIRWQGTSGAILEAAYHTNTLLFLCVADTIFQFIYDIFWWIEVHFNVDWSIFHI